MTLDPNADLVGQHVVIDGLAFKVICTSSFSEQYVMLGATGRHGLTLIRPSAVVRRHLQLARETR